MPRRLDMQAAPAAKTSNTPNSKPAVRQPPPVAVRTTPQEAPCACGGTCPKCRAKAAALAPETEP